MINRRLINPWQWQDSLGFVQGVEIFGAQRALICSGQASVDADGRPVHPDDMRAQLVQAFDNLEAVLRAADYTLANIVRLNYYTTDVDRFLQSHDAAAQRVAASGARFTSTLLGVSRLAFPELLVEIEATAVR
jgi:enamine deaminase RidA (YjgF/YER057c/UK114 family)